MIRKATVPTWPCQRSLALKAVFAYKNGILQCSLVAHSNSPQPPRRERRIFDKKHINNYVAKFADAARPMRRGQVRAILRRNVQTATGITEVEAATLSFTRPPRRS
eukprot:4092655-Pleurochrysis_carterae.AAC.2